jgi:hypothetical protein
MGGRRIKRPEKPTVYFSNGDSLLSSLPFPSLPERVKKSERRAWQGGRETGGREGKKKKVGSHLALQHGDPETAQNFARLVAVAHVLEGLGCVLAGEVE